jgi:hypothetical protein
VPQASKNADAGKKKKQSFLLSNPEIEVWADNLSSREREVLGDFIDYVGTQMDDEVKIASKAKNTPTQQLR